MAEANQRDLVLRPGEYTFISDENKGKVAVLVGPYKVTLGQTDKPVIFSLEKYRFIPVPNLEDAIKQVICAPKGFYVTLKNPSKDGKFPIVGSNDSPEMEFGKKVNIPGPTYFSLWPGQMATIVRGHHLRSNQYLLVRVYDEDAARANWDKAVVTKALPPLSSETYSVPQELKGELIEKVLKPLRDKVSGVEETVTKEDLTTGKIIVIMGTVVTFYIPPTGIEVLAIGEKENPFVQDAVTLESLEYCVLLDEDGNKRYVQGPDVVFPSPTETFLTRDIEGGKTRKFKAIELNEISGLYIKVIESYEENGVQYKEGDELFLTGKNQSIYFPRPEHSIIKYGNQEIHYAVAVPAGEARYVMDRISGVIETVKGPQMLLLDPRKKVSVRRVLSPNMVSLMYPGNITALKYNTDLSGIDQVIEGYISDIEYNKTRGVSGVRSVMSYGLTQAPAAAAKEKVFTKGAVSDEIQRGTKFTPPRSITLDSKYDGAPKINVWTGYAVLVVNGKGERKIIVGPAVYHLEYDEYLEKLALSTGKPKSSDKLLEDVYLRVKNNLISDIIMAETKDLIQTGIRVSYRVNFEDEEEYKGKWFNVENYVKFLTDDLRSIVRNAVKKMGIQEFNATYIDVVRNIILGMEKKEGERVGRLFKENGMRVTDVEVLELTIEDKDIASQIEKAQMDVIRQTIQVTTTEASLTARTSLAELQIKEKKLDVKVAQEKANATVQIFEATQTEAEAKNVYDMDNISRDKNLKLESLGTNLEVSEKQKKFEVALALMVVESSKAVQKVQQEVETIKTEILKAQNLAIGEKAEADKKLYIEKLQAEADAKEKELKALQPELVAALEALAQTTLVKDIGPNIVPLAILENITIVGALKKLFEGTSVAPILEKLGQKSTK